MNRLQKIFGSLNAGVVTIAMVYLAFGLSWILFSDALVLTLYPNADSDTLTSIQTIKGWFYILFTTLMLFVLISNFARKLRTAVEQQQESGNVLKKVVEEVGVGIARLDTEGRFLYANPDCCKFFGFTEEELTVRTLFDLTHPDDRAQDHKCWKKLIGREIDHFKLQKRFLNKFNQVLWADEKLSIVEDAHRDPKYLVLVIHNISDLKKAKEKLEENIRYYQTVLENSFDGVSIVDRNGVVKYQTPSVERIIGYPKESRLGSSAMSFIAEEDLPKVNLLLKQIVDGDTNEARTIVRFQRADRKLRYLDLHVHNMLQDPVVAGIVVNFRDITERYQIENKLLESEEQYKLLFENNPIPAFIYDPKTLNYLEVNAAAVKNYGYTSEEFLTMNLKDIRPPEDIPELLEDIDKIDKGTQERSRIWRHKTKSGELKYVEISAVNIPYNGQKARMSIANDVTHIIANQEQIRESEERYRHLVENLPAGAVLVRGENLYFNKAVSEITGYGNNEIQTLGEWFGKLYHEDADIIRKYYEEDRRDNFSTARTVSLTTKAGEKKWCTFYAYKFETGEVWLIQDITERKKMDELILQSNMEAAHRERREIAEKLNQNVGKVLDVAMACLRRLDEEEHFSTEQRDEIRHCLTEIEEARAHTHDLTQSLGQAPLPLGSGS